jgi:hypothetical protein
MDFRIYCDEKQAQLSCNQKCVECEKGFYLSKIDFLKDTIERMKSYNNCAFGDDPQYRTKCLKGYRFSCENCPDWELSWERK